MYSVDEIGMYFIEFFHQIFRAGQKEKYLLINNVLRPQCLKNFDVDTFTSTERLTNLVKKNTESK